ncbi:MAG: hypothetical protein IK076_06105, partial [Bacteroidales bacterium]|nr:hypothetical protein [Bacteroidales bacterium]
MKCIDKMLFLALMLSSSLLTPLSAQDVRVAAFDSPDKDKAAADYVCTGKDDQETIQKAIDAVTAGGTVFLASGNYYIDAFHPAEKGPDYALKTRRLEGRPTKLRLKGTVRANGSAIDFNSSDKRGETVVTGTHIIVSRACYDALPDEGSFAVIRGDDQSKGYGDWMAQELTVNDLSISLPDNQKNIICIDGFALGALNVDDVRVGTRIFNRSRDPEQSFRIGVEGCIGIRGVQGSNNGSETIFSSTYAIGLGIGFALSGEHLVCIQLGAIGNLYGYTFNSSKKEEGCWAHPITLINCCDEVSANYPLFGPNPSGQNVDLINFNMEHYTTMFSKGGDYAREAVPGQWGGNIDYDIQDWERDTWNHPFPVNSPYRRFWAPDGSGEKTNSRNDVQKNRYTSSERRSIAPNYGQVIFDEDLGRPLYCLGCGDYACAIISLKRGAKQAGDISLQVGNTKRTVSVPEGMKDRDALLDYIYRQLMVYTSCRILPEEGALLVW